MITVANSGLVAPAAVLDAIRTRTTRVTDLEFRVQLCHDENLADSSHGALRLTAKARSVITASRTRSFFRNEPISEVLCVKPEMGLITALCKPYFFNLVAFRLRISCSYCLEVSADLLVVRYIRVRASNSSGATPTELTDFGVFHAIRPTKIVLRFCVPERNVASAESGFIIRPMCRRIILPEHLPWGSTSDSNKCFERSSSHSVHLGLVRNPERRSAGATPQHILYQAMEILRFRGKGGFLNTYRCL